MVEIAPARAGRNDALARTLRVPLKNLIAATGVKLQLSVLPGAALLSRLSSHHLSRLPVAPGPPPAPGIPERPTLS
jgi:hypothetical protein